MSKEEQELLLTTARILRAHLKGTADSSPVKYETIIQDVRDLNLALRPFESNVTAIQPNQASVAPDDIERAKKVCRDRPRDAEGKLYASTSYIQRKLSWNYNHAAAVIEALEAEGWCGPHDLQGRRPVLGS